MKRSTDIKTSDASRDKGMSFYERVMMHNISGSSFYISRANIVFERNGNILSGFANIKYKAPDKYLVSIRSIGGFEVVRAFISGDTLMVNDRINRKLMYGKPDYLNKMFGIDPSMLAVIFGDFYYDAGLSIDNVDCNNGLTKSNVNIGKYKGIYTLNCDKEKVITSLIESGKMDYSLMFNFSDFYESGNLIIPKSISVEQKEEAIKISIEIKSVEYPWAGDIEFIPGSNYEKVQLL